MNATKTTGNKAELIGTFRGAYGKTMEVRFANSGDHWPGYDEHLGLRRGYWVGDHRRQDWIGLTKTAVKEEAISCMAYDSKTGEAAIEWL